MDIVYIKFLQLVMTALEMCLPQEMDEGEKIALSGEKLVGNFLYYVGDKEAVSIFYSRVLYIFVITTHFKFPL